MQQTWHIFKKDARYLYREIAFLFMLAGLFAWLQRPGVRLSGDNADTLELLYVAAVSYTIARLIHAEAIPGENQFWVTRPYRWPSLLAAKIMFVIAFVHLPVLFVQTLILLIDGFPIATILPGLLWTQILIVLAISLPCLALGAVTVGMVPFIAIVLLLLVIGLITIESRFRAVAFAPESIEWLRYTIPFIAAAIALPPVLYIQYRYRRTRFAGLLAGGAALCGAIAFMFLQWSTLFTLQSLTSRQSLPVEVKLDPGRVFQPWLYADGRVGISLPFRISGVPAGVRPQIELFDLQLQRADGRTLPLGLTRVGMGLHRNNEDPNQFILSGILFPDRSFLDGIRGQPVTLHLSLYLTLYGNTRDQTIPFQTTPINALDGLRCLDGDFDEIVCRAPFRWPGRIVSAKSPWGGLTAFTRLISYSPFPANLQLAPVVERSAGPHWSRNRQSPREVTIEVEEPLAFLRRDIVVPNLSLGGQQ